MTISACFIVRDDPHLARAVESIRPWVEEIVIVSELDSPWLRSLADRFEVCTEYLGTEELLKGRYPWLLGRLVHFGAMRQRAFDIASGDYLTWMDSDDLLVGGEHLADAVRQLEGLEAPRLLCKYEYYFDAQGRCTYVQWRERVVRNDRSCQWQHRGHEHIVPVGGKPTNVFSHSVIWKHERADHTNKPGLNLALVRLEAEERGYDGWVAYNLGSECFLTAGWEREEGERKAILREAIEHLEAYWSMSGWDDQRCFAALKLVDCHVGLDPGNRDAGYAKAQEWAARAHELRPQWVETNVALANMAMLRSGKARGEGLRAEMRTVLEYCGNALNGKTETPVGTKLRQEADIYGLMQAAHDTLEDWPAALDGVRKLLAESGEDTTLRLCERTYDEKLRGIAAVYGESSLDIVIAAPGFSSEQWDPEVFEAEGLGGSETAIIEMAKRLAAMGHRVRVYGNPTRPGLWDGVQYYQYQERFGTACDVLIAWRLAPLVEWCDAKVRMLWVHDTIAHSMTSKMALQTDAILALSEWHRGNLVKNHRVHPRHVRVTRNGIDVTRFQKQVRRQPRRAIYSSSPDRGLAVLLDLWPRIRAQVPNAELDVFYGFDGWRKSLGIKDDIHHRYVIAHCEESARKLAEHGVTLHGRVNQHVLADAMLGAGVWCSPTHFNETSCIGAMEAQAAGLRIVTSAIAALNETVGNRGMLIEGDWLTAEYQDAFVQHVVEALTWEHWGAMSRQELQEYARAHFSWDGVAQEWDAMMRELLDGAACGMLPPYYPYAA